MPRKKLQTYTISPQAKSDLRAIVNYISLDNPNTAQMMLERFRDAFRLLSENPHAGHSRPDLTDREILFWHVRPRYQVLYTNARKIVEVLRVFPADRDIAREISQT